MCLHPATSRVLPIEQCLLGCSFLLMSVNSAPGIASVTITKLGFRATVCVPAFNESLLIEPLLETLRVEAEACSEIQSVLVETSGSTDGTNSIVQRVSKSWPKCSLLSGPDRIGLASSLARMIELARTSVIVRVDADVKLMPGTIAKLMEELKSEGVGIVGPQIVPESSGYALLDLLVGTEYVLHHLVSSISPKITNVQVFRKFTGDLPHDVETEDILIQDLVTSNGFKPKYVPDEVVIVVPPGSVIKLFRQRVRSITSARWYRARTGKSRTPTHSPSVVVPAILQGFRSGSLRVLGFFAYLIFELVAHAYSGLSVKIVGHIDRSTWASDRTT